MDKKFADQISFFHLEKEIKKNGDNHIKTIPENDSLSTDNNDISLKIDENEDN